METEVKDIVRKSFTPPELKLDIDGKEGTFEAVFATMNVVDKDGDVTLNGAFGEQRVKISQYNHGSWSGGVNALPVGVGKIFERGNDAVVQGKFNLDLEAGKETYKALKFIAENGHTQEWSYALPFIDFEYKTMEDGRRVRVLKKITVPEVSPVLMGAGNDTRLLSIKGKKADGEETATPKSVPFAEQAKTVLADVRNLVKRFQEIEELRKAEGKAVSLLSTDELLKLRDELQPVMTELDEIYKNADSEKSDYLMLKNLFAKHKE
jgi:hypothetical protein